MAVQAQYPSNILSDFRKRVRPPAANENRSFSPPRSTTAALGSVEDYQLPPVAANLLRMYNSGLNASPQPILTTPNINENEGEVACNLSASRKRLREDEVPLARQHVPFLPLSDFPQNAATCSPFVISNSTSHISTGLRLAFDDVRLVPAATSTSGSSCSGSSLASILSDELQSQYFKQREEIDQLIKIQGERTRQALEEKRQRHTRALLSIIEESVMKRLKEKDVEVEKISRRNMELEERVKHLSLESQFWQNLAKNNEVMVSNLRSNLEQVVAQSREQSKEGCGESDVDDAESCNFGESGDAHARTVKENRDLKEQRNCRVCRTNSVCILLLPCRHLCLCKECDSRRAECPLCGANKNASVQVYME